MYSQNMSAIHATPEDITLSQNLDLETHQALCNGFRPTGARPPARAAARAAHGRGSTREHIGVELLIGADSLRSPAEAVRNEEFVNLVSLLNLHFSGEHLS